jgi:hypothetical protein
MNRRSISLGLVLLALTMPAFASNDPSFDAELADVISKLNREASVEADSTAHLANLLQREYRTADDELKWAVKNDLTWGTIAAMAYIQATNGRSFSELTEIGADWAAYVETAGMSPERMTRSLEKLLKLSEKERNSRIFEQLRSSRRIHTLPDLGSGFGLFQETMDFRSINQTRPTKVHDGDVLLTKGGGK